MTNTIAIQELAKQTIKQFERKERDNKVKFYCHKDNAPSWIVEMTREAHSGIMPNDYIFDFVVDSLYLISECDNQEQIEDRINEIEPDIYNNDLLLWVSNNLSFPEYVNEAVQEFGIDQQKFNLFHCISLGQLKLKQEVAYSVLNSLQAQIEE